jgi:DNA-binding transcriptional ArsR family regulator
VRDFSGTRPSSLRVSFDVRTAFDFVFSLSDDAGSTDDLPQSDRRWLDEGRTRLRTHFGESVDLYGQELCIVMAALAVDRPEVRDAAAFVDLVGTVDDRTIIKTMLGEELRRPETHDLVERALAGDHDAVVELAQIAAEGHPGKQRAEFAIRLFERPESVLGPTRGILASWLDHYAQVEDRVRAMIERDVDLRADDRASLPAHELIEKTTGGIRFGSEPGVVRVILAPSYFSRPYNFLLGADDWRLYGYPISDAALDSADPLAPPLQVVRLHRALGDDTRLRILRLLRDRDLYLTEIAQLLELSKPTIKHHLAQLRSAGLVTVTEEAGLTYYSLRRDRLDAASSELKRFLLD